MFESRFAFVLEFALVFVVLGNDEGGGRLRRWEGVAEGAEEGRECCWCWCSIILQISRRASVCVCKGEWVVKERGDNSQIQLSPIKK